MNFVSGQVDMARGGVTLAHGDTLVPVAALGGDGRALNGRRVDLGIRSEDISVRRAGEAGPSPGALSGVVDFVETLGNDALASVRIGPGDAGVPLIVARVETRRTLDTGTPVQLTFDPARIHLFDAATGASLREDGRGR